MRVFARVVEAGSFTQAAQQMSLTTAHVSRAVADLERHLRTRL
ncbi:LysR family transcriptional regulator, partial [Salmonella enterica]